MPRHKAAAVPAEDLPELDLDGARALLEQETVLARQMAPSDPYMWGNRLARLERLSALLDATGGEVHLPAVAAMRRR